MSSSGKMVLLVEDNEDNRIVYSTILKHFGYEVTEALNGEEGIAKARSEKPDLILMDISIPVIDGWEATQVLKHDPSTKQIPIIALTAHASTENKVEGLDAGADDYITKPINFAELEARVNSLLRIKALQSDLAAREKELSELNDKLRRISLTDGLTQIENRRSLEERLNEMWQHSLRLHEPIAIVMCDI